MIPRVRTAGIALLAVLAVAPPCLAAVGMAPGRGAIGGQLGGSLFWADGDYSKGAKPRMAFSGHFRYVLNNHLRWQVSPGFTWAGYSASLPIPVPDGNYPGDLTKKTNLTLLLPMTFEVQWLMHTKKWHYHLGAGPGIYRLWIENHRIPLSDPKSFARHQGLYAGVTGELGVERFVRQLPSTSVEACVATHCVFARRDAQFPSGYNSSVGVTEIRIGANYYFDMGRLRRQTTELPPARRK